MNNREAAILRKLKAIETKAWMAKEKPEADIEAHLAWAKAAEAVRAYHAKLPYGGRR